MRGVFLCLKFIMLVIWSESGEVSSTRLMSFSPEGSFLDIRWQKLDEKPVDYSVMIDIRWQTSALYRHIFYCNILSTNVFPARWQTTGFGVRICRRKLSCCAAGDLLLDLCRRNIPSLRSCTTGFDVPSLSTKCLLMRSQGPENSVNSLLMPIK